MASRNLSVYGKQKQSCVCKTQASSKLFDKIIDKKIDPFTSGKLSACLRYEK